MDNRTEDEKAIQILIDLTWEAFSKGLTETNDVSLAANYAKAVTEGVLANAANSTGTTIFWDRG